MKLGKILTYQKGRSPQKDLVSENLILYLTPEYLRGNSIPNYISDFPSKVKVENGDLLLLWDGSNAGEFFMGKEGFLSSTMVKFKFNEGDYNREFLFYQLKSFEGFLKSQTNGSGIPHVDKDLLLGIEVQKFQKPEQTCIAQILSKADQAIEKTEKLIAKYQRIQTGLMQDLLTNGIDEHGKIRSEKTHHFKTENGLRVPKEWSVTTLEQLTGSVITYGIVQAGPHTFDGIPYIRTGDMSGDSLYIDNLLRTTNIIASRFFRSQVEEGDIVFALRATIGKVLIVPKELNGANLTQGTARIAPNLEKITSLYLLWAMRMFYFKNQILKTQKGTTFSEITLGDLRQMLITHPNHLDEQNRITSLIEEQETTIQLYKSSLSKLQSLKTGLMQDLLSGKVRITIKEVVFS